MTTTLQRNNTKMIGTMKRNRLVVTSTWWKLLSQVEECHPDYATYYSYDINKQNFFNATRKYTNYISFRQISPLEQRYPNTYMDVDFLAYGQS
jgi:hypothetical protein